MSMYNLGDKIFIWNEKLHKYTMQTIQRIERKEGEKEFHYMLDNGERLPESQIFTGKNELNM